MRVLAVTLPPDAWEGLLREGVVVANPGHRRRGRHHTDTEGHWLYGRVARSAPDPVFSLGVYVREWM